MGNKKKHKDDEILTCAEVARELKTSRQTVWKWIALGVIESEGCFQIGRRGRWRIYKSAIEKAKAYSNGGVNSKWINTF